MKNYSPLQRHGRRILRVTGAQCGLALLGLMFVVSAHGSADSAFAVKDPDDACTPGWVEMPFESSSDGDTTCEWAGGEVGPKINNFGHPLTHPEYMSKRFSIATAVANTQCVYRTRPDRVGCSIRRQNRTIWLAADGRSWDSFGVVSGRALTKVFMGSIWRRAGITCSLGMSGQAAPGAPTYMVCVSPAGPSFAAGTSVVYRYGGVSS